MITYTVMVTPYMVVKEYGRVSSKGHDDIDGLSE
jgi:hypothetical protein